jgi:hypothetical protein
MIGSLYKLFITCTILVLGLGFLLVPFGETSAPREIVEHATLTPPPPPQEFHVFNPVAAIDISQPDLRPMQITEGGCCSYAGWSVDSEWVLYLDGESGATRTGLYSIPRDGGSASLVTDRYGVFSADWSLVAYPESGQVYIEQWSTTARSSIPSSGREVSISPDMRFVVWEFGSRTIQSPDRRQSQVWIANVDGSAARELVTLHGGTFQGWLGGSDAILATGRLSPTSPAGIWKIDTSTGAAQLLFEVERARQFALSTSGEWLAFIIAFEQDTRRNGIWILKTDGTFTQRLQGFGAYRWRLDGQLLLMPQDLDKKYPGLYQIDMEGGRVWRLIDPETVRLDITNNDWSVSPNGKWLLFHASSDRNLWVMELPHPDIAP